MTNLCRTLLYLLSARLFINRICQWWKAFFTSLWRWYSLHMLWNRRRMILSKDREQSIKKAILLASKWVPFDEWKVRILFMIHQISWPYECKIKKNHHKDLQLKNKMPTKEGAGGKSRDLLCILCPVLPTIKSFYDNAFPRKTTTRYCSRYVQ